MVRRVKRVAPLGGIPPEIARIIARNKNYSYWTRGVEFRAPTRPAPAQGHYRGRATTPIPNGHSSAVVAAGAATVYVGPMGTGTVWFPTMAVIGTTTGAADTSTCSLYLSPLMAAASLASLPQLGGQSYAGGGDTIGLSLPPVHPGTYIIAVWKNATNNDLATLTVYGDQQALVM
jgi:hypothetical protein